jgi:hypothetical protein
MFKIVMNQKFGAIFQPSGSFEIFPSAEVTPWKKKGGKHKQINFMKKCSYCGAEYPDDAVMCAVDHTPFERPAEASKIERSKPEYRFPPISDENRQKDFVTLVTCATLPAADVILGRLEAAGIEATIPDELTMNVMGGGQGAFGFVWVQVASKDYDAARELLGDIYEVRWKVPQEGVPMKRELVMALVVVLVFGTVLVLPLMVGVWVPDILTAPENILAERRLADGHVFRVVQYWNHCDFYSTELRVISPDGQTNGYTLDGDDSKSWSVPLKIDEQHRMATVTLGGKRVRKVGWWW